MNKVGILTVSDRASEGIYDDVSGPLIANIIGDRTSWTVAEIKVVGDEIQQIRSVLETWIERGLDLILTTGGTGFSPRDITPEATLEVIEREAPGIAEALRADGMMRTHYAMLSRGVAGIKERTLIINLPGSPKAVRENMDLLIPVLSHAIELLSGDPTAESRHRTV